MTKQEIKRIDELEAVERTLTDEEDAELNSLVDKAYAEHDSTNS